MTFWGQQRSGEDSCVFPGERLLNRRMTCRGDCSGGRMGKALLLLLVAQPALLDGAQVSLPRLVWEFLLVVAEEVWRGGGTSRELQDAGLTSCFLSCSAETPPRPADGSPLAPLCQQRVLRLSALLEDE